MGFNPQQIRQMRERNEQERAKELAAIAAGTIQDPRLSIQSAGPLSASARKFQQAQLKKVIGPLSPTREAQIIRSALAFDQKIREADRIQAEQRVRAGAVGARSEAVKQQEQRAVAASKGTVLGTIKKAPSSSSQPTPPKDTGPKVIKVTLSDSVQATSSIGGSYGPEPPPIPKGSSYFVLGPASGVPQLFSFTKQKEDDYKIPNPYGPPEKPQQQGPKEINDPWGIIGGSNQLLTGLETKAIESKKIIDSEAPLLGINPKGTKAKAYIESFEVAIAKNLASFAGFLNIGAGAAARQKGEQYDKLDIDLGLGEFGKFEIPSVERVKVPDTAASIVLQNAAESKGSVPEIVANIPASIIPSLKKYTEKYGEAALAGEGANLAVDAILLRGLSPIKLLPKFIIHLESGASRTVRTLVTYGGKELFAKAGGSIARTSEKAVLKSGILDDVSLPKMVSAFIEKKGRGAENEFLGPIGSKVFSSDKVLNRLKEVGKLNADDISLIKASKTIVQESKGVPNKPFRDDYSAQPFENIPEELTQTQLQFFRERGITLEGSAIDIPTFLPEFAGKAGDFDVHVKNFLQAQKISKENARRLNTELSKYDFVTFSGKKVKSSKITYVSKGGKLTLYKVKELKPITVYPKIKLNPDEVLHGATKTSIKNIKLGGVDISASKRGTAFFTTKSFNLAKHYGSALAKVKIDLNYVLKFKDLPKKIQSQLAFYERAGKSAEYQPIIINFARSKGFKAVEKPYYLETELTEPRLIKQGGAFKVIQKKYYVPNPKVKSELIIFDESIVKGINEIPLGKKLVPILGKKFGKGKAGEFLSEDDPESLGQITKSESVFGVKTPTKKIKIEGVKQRIHEYQLHRRAAEVSSFQLKEGKVSVGPSINKPGEGSTRVKDFPRFYAGGKTSAFLFYIEKGKLSKALNIEAAANEIKRIGEKEINFEQFFKERRLTEKYVQPPNTLDKLSKSISNIADNPRSYSSVYSESLLRNNLRPQKEKSPPNIDREVTANVSPIRVNKNILDKVSPLSNTKSYSSNLNLLSKSISKITKSKTTYQSPKSSINSQLSKSNYGLSKLTTGYGGGSPITGYPKSPVTGYPRSPITGYPGYPSPGGGGPPGGSPSLGSLSSSPITLLNIPPPKLNFGGILLLKQKQKKSRRVPARSKQRIFIADVPDPLRAAVILPAGVKPLYARTRKGGLKIFKKIDISLGKARRKKYAIRPLGI